jgi:DNA-binding LacI/PurR family transcriptional regulator
MRHAARTGRNSVTIMDVARHVGVATSTVSRALGNPGRVSEALRQRVADAADALGYRPNPQARSLISGRTGRVALLVPDITNPYFGGLIRGTQIQLRARGYGHLLFDLENTSAVETAALDDVPASVDGLILMGPRVSNEALAEVSRRVPTVVINRLVEGVPSVVVEAQRAMAEALAYLASLGHRTVAYAAGPAISWSSARRWEALTQAAPSLGVRLIFLGHYDPGPQSGAAAADAALHAGATACLFFNDMLALAALKRFAARQVGIPGDISVIGGDDIFGADFCHPPLTTISVPTERLGGIAADMLLAHMHPAAERAAPRFASVTAHLTLRASADSARTVDAAGAPRHSTVTQLSSVAG